ncbi:hypothetical protein LSTR_LSTR001581 [Laodelphax striatellus]|uniref:NADH dehydrogenase [ubiquinone] 1 beta subcomplex subunit 3 n=1 Tax=Laodelphax striatellus TaxID=195883 RepID=A0A482XCR7_LAOST|nr:hypothetical protein LSTR_LSTR001581 [Laodelphax striatellus]
MGGHSKIEIPDWKSYKVEDVPELMRVKEALAKKGLKDPWLRNEVWRYHPSFGGSTMNITKIMLARGFKYGLGLTAASIAIEYAYAAAFPSDDHHGHGHHDDHH